MAAPTLYKAAGDKFSTTLAAGISAADLSIQLSSVTGLNSSGGMLIIDEGVSSEEVIAYTSYIGTTLTVPSGGRGLSGTTAAIHSIGAVVKDILVADHVNKAYTSFTAEHSEAGVHSAATVTSLKASTAEIETGTSDVKVMTPLGFAGSEYAQVYNSMSRQAIINGNFDIWQRGTSFTNAVNADYTSDRWNTEIANTGTLPTTITTSRQSLTVGDISGAFYFFRIAPNGAGSGFGVNDFYANRNKIEFGVRSLCGASKTVTVSFWARSSIANKKIGVSLYQHYGTGGSPTSVETINGSNWTLTSSWTKYTYTFTTNTLVGKTFGTNNDDHLDVRFGSMWGSTNATVWGASGAETFVGSGNIDIAQVQLCSGDVALPFQPKSFDDELRACQRYYEKSYKYTDTVPTSSPSSYISIVVPSSTFGTIVNGQRLCTILYKVQKRNNNSPVIYPFTTATNTTRVSSNGGTDLAANSGYVVAATDSFFTLSNNSAGSLTAGNNELIFNFSVDAEL